jgi:hypothetical protein
MQSQQKNMSKLFIGDSDLHRPDADVCDSYEGLPPDYTLGHNMLAGAFAGIAVRFFAQENEAYFGTNQFQLGTLGDVPSRSPKGAYPRLWASLDQVESTDAQCRHECKS